MNTRRSYHKIPQGGIFKNRDDNNNFISNIDYKLWIQRGVYRTFICITIFIIVLILKNINTAPTNYTISQIDYRLNQKFSIVDSYDMGKKLVTNILKEGEKALTVLNFNDTNNIKFIMPKDGKIATFFDEEMDNARSNFKGIILEGDIGEKIVATQEGVVMEVGSNASIGNYIIIKHRGELLSVYKNMEYSIVEKNQKVSMGEEIGSSSGRLVFEVWNNSKPVDPLLFLNIDIEEL